MGPTRRQFLAGGTTAAITGLAGCSLLNAASNIEGAIAANDVEELVVEDLSQNFTGTSDGRALVVFVRVRNDSEETIPAESICAEFNFFDADDEHLDTTTRVLERDLPPGEVRPISYAYTERPDDVDWYTVALARC